MRIDWERVQVNPTSAGRSRHIKEPSGNNSWGKVMACHDIWFVWIGTGMALTPHGEHPLFPGACVWCRPGGEYRITWDAENPIGNYYIRFDLLKHDLTTLSIESALPPEYFRLSDVPFAEAMFRRMVQLVLKQHRKTIESAIPPDCVTRIVVSQMLKALLMDIDASTDGDYGLQDNLSTHVKDAMNKAATRIVESPEQNLRISDLAKDAGYSIEHFSRTFRKVIGIPPKQYVMEMRMLQAERMLTSQNTSIKEIAFELGYESISHFSNQFKKLLGQSPAAYRSKQSELP